MVVLDTFNARKFNLLVRKKECWMDSTYISLANCDLITFIDFAVVRSESEKKQDLNFL